VVSMKLPRQRRGKMGGPKGWSQSRAGRRGSLRQEMAEASRAVLAAVSNTAGPRHAHRGGLVWFPAGAEDQDPAERFVWAFPYEGVQGVALGPTLASGSKGPPPPLRATRQPSTAGRPRRFHAANLR